MVRPEYEIIRIDGSVFTLSSCTTEVTPCYSDCQSETGGCDLDCNIEYCTGSDD